MAPGKNKVLKFLSGSVLAALLLFMICCKKKNASPGEDPRETGAFNKQELLVNLADNIILPCYTGFKTSLDSLMLSYNTFKSTGSENDFQVMRQKFDLAYLRYQRISIYGFGPGEDAGIRSNFNIFPTDTTKIKNNISSGTYNLSAATNYAAKGMPALEYLFYDYNKTLPQIVTQFTSDAKRRTYVDNLLGEMSQKINSVVDSWNSGYRQTFVTSLGTDVGSSIGYVINQLNYELDYLKNAKIATPLGLRSGGTPLPDNSEAYYSGLTLKYALETLNAIENVYLGRSFSNVNGTGFDDYLDHLNVRYQDNTLNAAINNQFGVARAKMTAIGDPLSEKVLKSPSNVSDAYKELVKLLVLLKTDLPSNLGVVITYQDGDGD